MRVLLQSGPHLIGSARGRTASLLCALALVVAGCGSSSGATQAPSAPAATAPPATVVASAEPTGGPGASMSPSGVAVIGHSGGTGADTDPDHPGKPAPANSWATGTNPAVQSIYLRMLATDPTIEGHALNLAINGSNVDSLVSQATQLVTRTPQPQLVLIETVDNDIRCDGTDDANLEPFRAKFTQTLQTLAAGLPTARIFVVSQWGTVKEYDRVMFAKDPGHITGDGPCDTVNAATGKLDPSREAYLQGVVDDYWAIVTAACAKVPTCRTDQGAAQKMTLAAEDITGDGNHLSIVGLAKKAAIEWPLISGGS